MLIAVCEMALCYVIKPDFFNHKIIGFPSLCSATTSLKTYIATKVEGT